MHIPQSALGVARLEKKSLLETNSSRIPLLSQSICASSTGSSISLLLHCSIPCLGPFLSGIYILSQLRIPSPSFGPSQALPEGNYLDFSTSLSQNKPGANDIKPFSLPSLASITANLASAPTEPSYTGPHRKSYSLSISGRRRFSPLGNSTDYGDPVSPLESELSAEGRSSVSGISMSIASGQRPRSHSHLTCHSLVGQLAESDAPVDESASDSGASDKKHEDNDSSMQVKKRSRTLTTPSQQRRLMQILEKTRFPSTEVREQLARELGMTPRRVQIWFQNRRQGMKKALEQKTEQETMESSMPDFARPRGYSFGTYPPAVDAYGQPGLHPLPEGESVTAGLPGNTGSGEHHSTSQSIDAMPQLYSSRSVSRGMPAGLAHLELSATTPNNEPGSTSVADFAWSDPSSAVSLYCLPSAVGGEASFPSYCQPDQQYPTSTSTQQHVPPVTGGRHRSQTNPDFLGMMNDFIELPGVGRTSHESLSIDPLQRIPGGISRQMANGRDPSLNFNEGWSNSYIQSAPAWQESVDNLKLDRLNDPSNNYYYSGGIQQNPDANGLAQAPLHFSHGDKYMGSFDSNAPETELAQHLRNRSHSLNF
ncbi:hypothetical protein PCASD_08808 [Puccinia coronata f. sp. avenae]|uniref:Homeobox domain-containing protein n=1 Tax=Puccinia coronata f. sp. avenae TaxID=200324 RepID=A0A2N5SXG2_9BASI|nr:hypothetical protein PCASD_17141 [Puccinia coronata f. sp. avenae]PLW39625.1 hypothetical protein PCASD_08808 [Puccinia coronata f. sp. avenae]